MTAIAPISLYIGDDWTFDIVALDSPGGSPEDLTGATLGAEFFQTGSATPAQIVVGAPASPSTGAFTVLVPQSLTVNTVPQAASAQTFPTRLHVFYTDIHGLKHTVGVIPIIPVRP